VALALLAVTEPGWTSPASASALATVNVPRDLRTGRVLLVRPHSIELVQSGTVVRSVVFTGTLDLARLPDLVAEPQYASWRAKGVLRLGAVLRAGPQTTVTGEPPVLDRIELGDAGGVSARILGSRATFRLSGVTVTAPPPAQGGPEKPGSLSFNASTVELTKTTLTGLGSGPTGEAEQKRAAIPALRVNGGTLAITDSTVTGGGDGIVVIDAENLTLQRVRTQRTGGDGIRVRGGSAGTIGAVTSTDNRRYGVTITGPTRAKLTGPFTLSGNRAAGLGVTNADHLDISNVTSTNDKRGVVVKGGNTVRLTKITTSRGDVGVTVTSSRAVTLTQVTSQHARLTGISVDADTVAIAGSTVTDARDGLVLQAKSRNVTVRDSAFSGSRYGVKAASAGGPVVLSRSRLDSAKGSALRITGPGTTVDGCTLSGANGIIVRGKGRLTATGNVVRVQNRAVDVGRGVAPVTVKGGELAGQDGITVSAVGTSLTMNDVRIEGAAIGIRAQGQFEGNGLRVSATDIGIRLSRGTRARVSDSTVTAGSVGIAASAGAEATLTNTEVRAPRPSRGQVTFRGPNRWSHEPMRWLGVGVLVALALGILMEMLRTITYRRERRFGLAPAHVLNRS